MTARLSVGTCQSPYLLKSPQEYILSGSSAGVSVTGFLFSQYKHKLTVDEIANLKSESINSLDRTAVKYYSHSAAYTSDVLMFSSIAIPLALLLDKNIRNHSGQSGVIYLETMAIASVGISLSKGIIRRPRPYAYNPSVPESEKQKTDATNSFFSGHTTVSAASTFFAAKVFCDYNPNSKWKPVVWIGAAAIPLATGFYRYRAGKHFPTDILVAFCYGALSGILIPQLHLQKIGN
ncbi:MAG: phosphatase PAP2 family protein [Bacteroidetes bacterium]|nr:phosphatase PAP2 family protein [Bacteroidota bacterium]